MLQNHENAMSRALMGHSGENFEDQKAERNENSRGPALEISEGSKDSLRRV